MTQLTFAEAEYNAKYCQTRRVKILAHMETLIPWKQLERTIQRVYPKNGQRRHP